MLKLEEVSLDVMMPTGKQTILHRIAVQFPKQHLTAIIGPSGCGKSTLLKVIAGIIEPVDGNLWWGKRNLATDGDLPPGAIGYVPQFGIAYEALTVEENVTTAVRLRISDLSTDQIQEHVQKMLEWVGLSEVADRRTSLISGGQKRRLALALEVINRPVLLLCDEVTSGLDPRSEEEITHRLFSLTREYGNLVLNVIHNLRHLNLYDSVVVMNEGRIVYHGSPKCLLDYFGVQSVEEIFPALAARPLEDWEQNYLHFYATPTSEALTLSEAVHSETATVAGALAQFWILLGRRLKLFFRDRGQLWLQVLLIFLFPAIVVLFAYDGLPQIQNLTLGFDVDVLQQLRETVSFTRQTAEIGGLVSGLVLFQVILLTLMGSNNAAREVVSERLIFEKEKLAGLHVGSYIASKVLFLALLVILQSVWMTVFVKYICHFEGDFLTQMGALTLVNAALTATCLAISSWANSPEKASLISIYLVGFQLPLSGTVLALPEFLGDAIRPFIASYWSWSAILQTMKETRFYDLVSAITHTPMSAVPVCFWVMGAHVAIGLMFTYLGCWRSRWN